MNAHVLPMTGEQMDLVPAAAERLRMAALGALAGLLGVVFLLLLVADQGRVVAGVL